MKDTKLKYLEVYGPKDGNLVVPHGDTAEIMVLDVRPVGDQIRYSCVMVTHEPGR